MGFEDEAEQSLPRPCRQTNGRSKRTCELTSSIVPRGTSFHRWVELEFPSIGFDPSRFSCCCRGALFSGPAELGAVIEGRVAGTTARLLRCTFHFRCGSFTTDAFSTRADQCPLLLQ
jgi:hypothetical protein